MQPADLARFIEAQEPVLEAVCRELANGRKQTHWMWYVFPQLAGLGHSAMARRYALASVAEARAYLAHPVLGPRLVTHTELVNAVEGRSARAIFGSPDDLKFHSSMSLFALASREVPCFAAALGKYFGGVPDVGTTSRLG